MTTIHAIPVTVLFLQLVTGRIVLGDREGVLCAAQACITIIYIYIYVQTSLHKPHSNGGVAMCTDLTSWNYTVMN